MPERAADALAPVEHAAQALGLVEGMEVAVIAAAVLAIVFHRLRQPAILAYITAGLLLGFFARPLLGDTLHGIEQVSHLGLVLLLFVIGLEMDLKGILQLGRKTAIAVVLQAPVSLALFLGIQWGAWAIGFSVPGLGGSASSWFYFAVAVSLSSTAVAIRLLGEKFDLTSRAGRISVLTLIAQDVWAVVALSYVASQTAPEGGGGVGRTFLTIGGALGMGAAILLSARYLLARIMSRLARSPDLVGLCALGWCFLCAAALTWVGLSAEMGALVAGISLGSFRTSAEVLAKVSSLRDFFMALFFVALGMSLPPPSLYVITAAGALAAITFASRLALYAGMLRMAGVGHVVATATSINLGQLSEFSLLLVPLGIGAGALTIDEGSIISYGLMLSMLLSTYAIKHNYGLAGRIVRFFVRGHPGRATVEPPAPATTSAAPEAAPADEGEGKDDGGHHPAPDIVLLGYFHMAEELVRTLKETWPELIPRILVIDFNLERHAAIEAHGLRVVYGDISNPETLRHYGADRAKVALCLLSDTFLRGTSNAALIGHLSTVNPDLRYIGSAETREDVDRMLKLGAYACVCPPAESVGALLGQMRRALR
jgi:Kef-type K+ transport system membrane component KefB